MLRDPDPPARAGTGPAEPSIELLRLARDVDTSEWYAELSCPLADRGTARLVVARGAALRPAELFRDLAGRGVIVPEARGRRRLLDALLRTEDAAPARLGRRLVRVPWRGRGRPGRGPARRPPGRAG